VVTVIAITVTPSVTRQYGRRDRWRIETGGFFRDAGERE
jgi:hypothetical protein